MASVRDQTLCSKVRVYQWNEIVQDEDKGDDLMVFLINNKILINNFPTKILNPSYRALARDVLYFHGFIDLESTLLTDDDDDDDDDDSTNRVLTRYVNWKELVKFDRRWLSDNDFGYKMLKALDPGLFLLDDDQTLVHLGKQISANFNSRFSASGLLHSKSRIVIKVEICRARTIQFEVEDDIHRLFASMKQQQVEGAVEQEPPHVTLLKSFPRNPLEKIPQAAFDPYFELDLDTVYDDQIHKLVTDCDPIIDEFIPEEDDIGGMFEILGFMRARILSLYPPRDVKKMLGSLRNRDKGRESGAYPYKLMSPEEAKGLVQVEPFHPRPPSDDICPICLSDYRSSPFAETCCFHTFHAACLSQWISKTPSCPLCRVPL